MIAKILKAAMTPARDIRDYFGAGGAAPAGGGPAPPKRPAPAPAPGAGAGKVAKPGAARKPSGGGGPFAKAAAKPALCPICNRPVGGNAAAVNAHIDACLGAAGPADDSDVIVL